MRYLFVALTLVATAFPAIGQTLDSRFSEMGTLSVTLDQTDFDLVIAWDTKHSRGYADERAIMGKRTFNIYAAKVRDDGKLGSPSVQMTFFVRDGVPDLISMQVFDEQGHKYPLTFEPQLGSGTFTEFTIDDANSISATFEATLLRVDQTDAANPVTLQGAAPIKVTGSVDVAVREPN